MDTNKPAEWAKIFDAIADELELAVAHCKTAASHYRDENIPRGAAHAWSASGHLETARALLIDQSRDHAARSRP